MQLNSQRIKELLTRFYYFIKKEKEGIWRSKIGGFLARLKYGIRSWTERFKLASPRQKWRMVRLPAILTILVFLIVNLAPFFTPPRIQTSFPGDQSLENPLDSQIEIIFNKGVIKFLVERTFSITPAIAGKFSWEGEQKIIFTPQKDLERNKKYQVEFKGIVLSKLLVPLVSQKTITFETIGNPKIVLYAPETEALEDLTPVTVIFDRPMIALTTATNSAIKKPAFEIQPTVKGEGRWLGTTAYQFRPSQRFRKATTYKVTVPAGIESQDDGSLIDGYSWEFSSERPRVEAVSPHADYNYASPTASVSATFNQPIDFASVAQKFKLFDKAGKEIPGRVVVRDRTVGFYASKPLEREQKYQAVIEQGVQSTEGPNGMEVDYKWSFVTAARSQVISTTPSNNQRNVKEEHKLSVAFKTPMDDESFEGNVFIDPKPESDPSLYFSSYNDRHTLSIGTYLSRSTEYTITIGANVKDQYGVPLGSSYTFKFSTAPYKPTISIFPSGTYFAAFNQQIIPRIVTKVVNTQKVNYSLYKLERKDFLDLYRRLYGQQCGSDYECRNWQNYDPSQLKKVRFWEEVFAADFNTPVHVITKVTTENGNKIAPGFYFLDVRIPQGPHDNMVMIVSRSTLTVKKSDKQIFTWAVDQTLGNVVPAMRIQLTDSEGKVLAEGETNSDGVFMQNFDLLEKYDLFVFGQKDDDIVVSASVWDSGISRYEFGLPSYYSAQERKDYYAKDDYKLFVTLDRPIYRPGQKVYFKGVIRKDNDGAYESLSPGEKVTVTVADARNREIYRQDLPITTFGSFASKVNLSEDANLGYYRVTASFNGNSFEQSFQVEEYKRPDLALTVKPSKGSFVQGETANVNISAAYYFGAPVTQAPLTWILQTQDHSFRWDKDWRFEFGDPDSYWSRPWWYYQDFSYYSGEKVTEGKGKTDSRGEFMLDLPLDISKYKTSQRMILEATVKDLNNQAIAASKEFTVHRSGLYVGLRPTRYSNQINKEVQVEIVTVDLNEKEVANIPVQVDFYKRTWETVREKNPDDGRFYYTSKPSDAHVASAQVTTDILGRATASFTPSEGGTYKATASVNDKDGNQSSSGSFFWVSGRGFSTARENHDRIVLVTDKRDYFVGEDLSIFVATPFGEDSAKTLLTVERGSVLDYKIVDTSDTSNNFAISISPKFSPNVFIGAVLIKGGGEVKSPPEFKIGYTEVKVTDKKQQIEVKITTNKQKYQPQETLSATIETTDVLGHPLSTEIAVGLVDKAVWDLSMVEFPDIYKFFYQPRNLEVSTAQLLTISLDRINANINLGAKGGSGGGGGGGFDTTRRDFPETAYWNPHLKTDAGGKANISIKLPDSLTTWRLATLANSDRSAFGSAVSEVTVSRDLLIRPLLPRFLSIGDQARLGAIVTNTSGREQNVTAKIEGEGLTIKGESVKQQVLADGAQTKILWATLTENVSSVKIKLAVEGNDKSFQDAVEVTLPVKSYGIPEIVATSGEAKDTAEEKIVLPAEIDTTQGEASVSFSPSLGSASLESLPYLFNYPYYCTEQIASRFIPAVFIHRILKEAKLDKSGSVSTTRLEVVINDAVQRFNNQQHADGGWGWWNEYRSDPFITAYVYLGLSEAKKDGFTVDNHTLDSAHNYLKNYLTSGKDKNLNLQAYILYVLGEKAASFSSYAANLFERRFELTLEARAYLVMAMSNMPAMENRIKRLKNELISLGKKTATTTHWEEARRDYQLMGSNTTTTASILEMLVRLDRKNPLISEIVRYLMSIRRDKHWATTRETAAVVRATSAQLLTQSEQKLDENYRVMLNGSMLKEGKFTKEDLLQLEEYIISISEFEIGEENNLRITKSGQGNLYYNVNLKYYLPFSEIDPLEQGMVIIREFVDEKGNVLSSDSLEEGSEVWVRLIIVAPEERHFVVIEDVLPAGLEAVNESLKNVSVLNAERPKLKEEENRLLYFEHKEYHDDRTSLFANFLPAGVYEFAYRVRATTPGRYHHPPAQAYQMYIPDVSGHSTGGWLEIK